MQLGHELLLDTLGPVLFTQKLRQELRVHLVQQVVKRVTVDKPNEKYLLYVGLCDRYIKTLFDKVSYLQLSEIGADIYELI